MAYRLVLPSRRTGFDAALAAAALSGGLATVIVLAPQGVTSPASASHVIHLFLTSFARSVTETFVLLANRVFHDALISKVVVFVSVFPVLVLSCFIGLHKSVRLVCLMFLTCVAAATAWRWRFDGGFLGEYYANERYFYIAMVMLAFSFVTLLFEEKRGLQLSGVCLTALLAAATASRFEKHPVTDFSGEWAAKSQYIGKQQVEIQYYPGWQMVVPSRGAAQRSNDR